MPATEVASSADYAAAILFVRDSSAGDDGEIALAAGGSEASVQPLPETLAIRHRGQVLP